MNRLLSKYLLYYPTTYLLGEKIYRYEKEYEEMQYDSASSIKQYQLAKLGELLNHAYDKSPYYRALFEQSHLHPNDIKSLDDFKRVPLLTKEDVINFSDRIKTNDKSLRISHKTTGGSTGEAVTIDKNSDALARERAATWRSYKWAGVSVGDPQIRMWGIPLTNRNRIKYRLIDFIANRKRLSAFNLDTENMHDFHLTMIKFKPTYIYGYASVIEKFAQFVSENKLKTPRSLKSIITTSEVLTDAMRDEIESTFGVRVFNEYGCGEVGSVAHECEHGNMHIMDDNLIVEIDGETDDNKTGELIITDLHNYSMPLIRYKVGDYATKMVEKCPCGRGLSAIENVHGRAYDCITLKTGRTIHPEAVMYIFESLKDKLGGVKQFQVIQKSYQEFTVNLVSTDTEKSSVEKFITDRMRADFGDDLIINFHYTHQINRERSGKIRLVKSEI